MTSAHGRGTRRLDREIGDASRLRRLVHAVQRAWDMKLEDMIATHNAPEEPDDRHEPCNAVGECVPEDVEPEALIVDEFDPTLSFRDAKERAIARWERWYVAQLLQHTRGNLSEAARIAHSDRGHLRKLARKHLRWDSRSSPSD